MGRLRRLQRVGHRARSARPKSYHAGMANSEQEDDRPLRAAPARGGGAFATRTRTASELLAKRATDAAHEPAHPQPPEGNALSALPRPATKLRGRCERPLAKQLRPRGKGPASSADARLTTPRFGAFGCVLLRCASAPAPRRNVQRLLGSFLVVAYCLGFRISAKRRRGNDTYLYSACYGVRLPTLVASRWWDRLKPLFFC